MTGVVLLSGEFRQGKNRAGSNDRLYLSGDILIGLLD